MVNELYNSIILTAISRHCDLESLVKETDRDAKELKKKNFRLPTGYETLYFIEALANKMGRTIGELYGMTEYQKEGILFDLIKDIDPTDKYIVHNFYDDEDIEETSFSCLIPVIKTLDKAKLSQYFRDFDSSSSVYTHYDLMFSRTYGTDDNPPVYSISITLPDITLCEYTFTSYEVWAGTDGYFADFIDRFIDELEKAKEKKAPAAPKEEPIDFKSFFVYGGEGKCPDKTHNHQE